MLGGLSRGHSRRGRSCSGRTILGQKVGNSYKTDISANLYSKINNIKAMVT